MMIVAEFGSVFYSVKFKDFDDRGMRRQADREFSRKAELESQIAKQREEYVTADLSKCIYLLIDARCRNAQKEAEKALAVKVSSGSNSKIIVPGTPRHPGLTGTRVSQTPRRRVGI
jgi:pre-mRNA-splicing factor ATP-dependent RNA helicase DHX38/PRP16